MIELTRLNGKTFLLNAELVETIEATPDTTIRLTSGRTYVVKEDCPTVKTSVLNYRRALLQGKDKSPPPGWNVIDSPDESPSE